MIGWTLCSGIGAPEVAAPDVDWRLASEIEAFPREVLHKRLGYKAPEDHNQGDPLLWSDMTEVTPELARQHGIPLPDLLVAGTPCQAFSIAGLRKGTDDDRGNLTLKFVETCHAIVNARPDGKLAVLWENVPGVLSDKGNALGCFLAGLVGADDALRTPDGESWPNEGMVEGPRARAAWRVLDAQYFGLAQRRRRVFVVVDFGNCVDPAAVLFERQGLHGHHPPRREAGEGTTHSVAPSLRARENDPHRLDMAAYAIEANSGDVSYCLAASAQQSLDAETETLIAFDCKGSEVQTDESGVSPPLRAMGHDGSHTNGGNQGGDYVAQNIHENQRGEVFTSDVSSTLGVGGGKPGKGYAAVLTGPRVRRLMPVECERLQGFPDGHTAVTYRNKPAADGPRYKALGNSMAVPCIAWIINRMQISMRIAE